MFLSPLVVIFCMDEIKYELASRVCLTVCLMLPFVPLLDAAVVFFVCVLSSTVDSSLR